jgi:Sulfotransferase domain
MTPKKPTFIIIGSAKCGTTALASILGAHPDCCMSNPKEVCFFQDNIDYQTNPNYEKGWEWYQQAFAHYKGEPVVGEATPSYSDRSRSPNTAKRIYEFNPAMKIIYLVRHPLERQISAWKMQYAFGKEQSFPWSREHKWALKGFEYWMQHQKEVNQWDECRYHFQLAAYLEYFPIEQILVSFTKDRRADMNVELVKILRFLGLDFGKQPNDFQKEANRADDRTIDRPVLKKMRTHTLTRMLVSRFPLAWREWARSNIARTQAVPPKSDLTEKTQSEFINYVESDAETFLKHWGKPSNYWPLDYSGLSNED